MRISNLILLSALFTVCSSNKETDDSPDQTTNCEWCGAQDAPTDLDWEATIAGENELGERLIAEGTIYLSDGKTPASDIIVYAYHTNSKGIYPKTGSETGNRKRHGYLRSWVKTNTEGKYKFHTIKPAPYPENNEPAHIHMTFSGELFDEYWVDATWFEGDSLITEKLKSRLSRPGGESNIVKISKNKEGVWICTRDITLNPPNGYK